MRTLTRLPTLTPLPLLKAEEPSMDDLFKQQFTA
ncbi:hypothetical protein AVEN_74861-1, partial [Araneus ventricosus]